VNATEHEWIPEDDVRELLRPHRPDPAAFRAGVARRIAERERDREAGREADDGRERPFRSALMRRAAAVLGAESLALPAAGKLASSKALPVALALPALLFAGALGGLFAGARSLARTGREADTVPADPLAPLRVPGSRWGRQALPQATSRWYVLLQLGSVVVMLAPFLFGARHAIDVLMVALLGSMALLVTSVRTLAEEVGLERRRVRTLCAVLLTELASGALMWTLVAPMRDVASDLGLGWSMAALLVGIVLCTQPGKPRLAAALGSAAFVVLLNPLGRTASTPGSLLSQVAGYDLATDDLQAWDEAAAIAEALRMVGEDRAELAEVRASVERAIESGEDAHPSVWTSAWRMGLIDDAHWRLLARRQGEARALDRLLDPSGKLGTDYYLYRVPMLLATRELDAGERAALIAKIERSWPDGGHDEIGQAATCVRALDAIGRPDLADARAADVAELLRRCWIGARGGLFANVGGFTSDPEKFDTSFPEPTWNATWLMARFDVPDGIDLRLLRGHLRSQARAFWLFGDPNAYLHGEDRASLLLLERGIGMPARTVLEHVLGERLLLAMLALIALCRIAIAQARPEPEPEPAPEPA